MTVASNSDSFKLQEGRRIVFDNEFFEKWLDNKTEQIMHKLDNGGTITSEEMIILVLKAQTNHFEHLDKDLREDMKLLRVDMDKRLEQMDKRLEQVDKRFEQVDKRFEQVDKRFEQMDLRFERFYLVLKWQLGILLGLFSGVYLKLFFG